MSGLTAKKNYPARTLRRIDIDHWVETLRDGTRILIRPLEPKDREREFEFIKNLLPETRHFRFLATVTEPGQTVLAPLMNIDYQQRMAYVALILTDGHLTEIGVARYAAMPRDEHCESAVVVADEWQRNGVGKLLMIHLIEAARISGFRQMISIDSVTNHPMRLLADGLGFECRQDPLDAAQVMYTLDLLDHP